MDLHPSPNVEGRTRMSTKGNSWEWRVKGAKVKHLFFNDLMA